MVRAKTIKIDDLNVSDADIISAFNNSYDLFGTLGNPGENNIFPRLHKDDLTKILNVAMLDRQQFPSAAGNKSLTSIDTILNSYMEKWIRGYEKERNYPISTQVLSPNSNKPDPALLTIVETASNLSRSDAEAYAYYHGLYMKAENMQGALLEEFLDSILSQDGWVWCAGQTLRAIDFCKPVSNSEPLLLQIKNKFNSENSSSSAIRNGTKIQKWNRIARPLDSNGNLTYNWSKLPGSLGLNANLSSQLTEENYINFVATHVKKIEN